MRFSKYFTRLLAAMTAISTVPIVGLGFFSYIISSGLVEERVLEGNRQVVLQSQLRIEQTLKTTDHTLTQFINLPYLVDVIRREAYTTNEFGDLRDLQQTLSNLQGFETGITEIILASLRHEWLLDNKGLQSLEESAHKERLLDYTTKQRSSFWSSEVDESGSVQLRLVKTIPNFTRDPEGFIIANLPGSSLQQWLTSSSFTGTMLIMNENHELIAHQSDKVVIDGLQEFLAEHQTDLTEESGQLEFTSLNDDHTYALTYTRSSYNHWIYATVIDLEELSRESRPIGYITFFTCIVTLVIILLFSFFGSRFVYMPVRRLYRLTLDKSRQEVSGPSEDELGHIERSVLSLVHEQEELGLALRGQNKQLKEWFITRLFSGKMKSDEIREKLTTFGYSSDYAQYAVLVLQVDTLEDTRFEQRDIDLLLFAVNNIVGELLRPEEQLLPVVIDQQQVTLLRGSSDTDHFAAYAYELAQRIQATIKSILQLQVSIGISRVFHSLQDSHNAYAEGCEALKYRIRIGDEALLSIDDVKPDYRTPSTYPEQVERELIDAIKLLNQKSAEIMLQNFIDEVFRIKRSSLEYQMQFIPLLFRLAAMLPQQGESSQTSLFDDFFNCRTADEIMKWMLKKLIIPIINELTLQSESQFKNISDTIKQIIEREFDSPITLESCAARISYSPVYVSRVFRKQAGITFIEYLIQVRIGAAKQWLIGSDMKIGEMAERLQYNNAQNFIRSFRKMEGMTPRQYRELHRDSGGAADSDS